MDTKWKYAALVMAITSLGRLSAEPSKRTPDIRASTVPAPLGILEARPGSARSPYPMTVFESKAPGFYRHEAGGRTLWFRYDAGGKTFFLPKGAAGPELELSGVFEREGKQFHAFTTAGSRESGYLLGVDGSVFLFKGNPLSASVSHQAAYVEGSGFSLP